MDTPDTMTARELYEHFVDTADHSDPAWQAGLRLWSARHDIASAIASVRQMLRHHWNKDLWSRTLELLEHAQGLAHHAVVRRVASEHQAEPIDGVLVDATTARGIVALEEALSDDHGARLRTMHIALKANMLEQMIERGLISLS